MTVKGVLFGMRAPLPEAVAVILLTVQTDQMINIAGLADFFDGKIVIENETPVVTRGARKVIDDTRKSKAMIKESAEVEIKE